MNYYYYHHYRWLVLHMLMFGLGKGLLVQYGYGKCETHESVWCPMNHIANLTLHMKLIYCNKVQSQLNNLSFRGLAHLANHYP